MPNLHHYTGSGLDYVYLANGYEIHETPFGKAVSIHNADELHRVLKPGGSGQSSKSHQ